MPTIDSLVEHLQHKLSRYEDLMRHVPEMREPIELREWLAALASLRADNANLRTVMVAAAEEIQAHWAAHCDADGYGPTNLMRRLECGIPAEYGYTAGAFASLQARLDAAERRIGLPEPTTCPVCGSTSTSCSPRACTAFSSSERRASSTRSKSRKSNG